ncbi:MAG: exonuclease SbcCD subunit D [Bauldia sp.]|nr:exonuclease SbcCD subunit D [Bauldia sp.]MCW5716887.1 exonuclease SbcCD subunit D [Bauldia sp.]
MRILHTADWHVGKTIARQSRIDESRKALAEVVAIAKDEKVDVVLVCGDVFEHLAPSPEAEEVVYEALLRFEEIGAKVLVIPGNHDAPRRWKALMPLLARCAVTVVPEVRRPKEGGVVELSSRDGQEFVQIAALPWVTERRIVEARHLMDLAEVPNQKYADEMGRLIGAMCKHLDPKKCTVFAGHLFVGGSVVSENGGERSLTVGQTFAVTPQALPNVQYVALGHVHRPQRVPGAAVPARYSGSLVQLDFGEAGQSKSVAIVDLAPGRPAEVREVPVRAGRLLMEVGGTLAELEENADRWGDAFLKVTAHTDQHVPGLSDDVRRRLPNAVDIYLAYPKQGEASPVATLRGMAPRDQFARYFTYREGTPPAPELLDLFDTILAQASP